MPLTTCTRLKTGRLLPVQNDDPGPRAGLQVLARIIARKVVGEQRSIAEDLRRQKLTSSFGSAEESKERAETGVV